MSNTHNHPTNWLRAHAHYRALGVLLRLVNPAAATGWPSVQIFIGSRIYNGPISSTDALSMIQVAENALNDGRDGQAVDYMTRLAGWLKIQMVSTSAIDIGPLPVRFEYVGNIESWRLLVTTELVDRGGSGSVVEIDKRVVKDIDEQTKWVH